MVLHDDIMVMGLVALLFKRSFAPCGLVALLFKLYALPRAALSRCCVSQPSAAGCSPQQGPAVKDAMQNRYNRAANLARHP